MTPRCSGCGSDDASFHRAAATDRARQVKSRCRACRREDYFRRYPEVCTVCGNHRPLEAAGSCRACLAAQGLRVCRVCRDVLPAPFSFYGASRVCRTCYPAHRRRKPVDSAD